MQIESCWRRIFASVLCLAPVAACDDPAQIVATPGHVALGDTLVGQPKNFTVRITHVSGGRSGNLSPPSLAPGDQHFSLIDDDCSGRRLGPNDACTINVHFDPSKEEAYSAVLSIASRGADEIRVPLAGRGKLPKPISPPKPPPPQPKPDPFWASGPDAETCKNLSVVFPRNLTHAGVLYAGPTPSNRSGVKKYPIAGYLQRGRFIRLFDDRTKKEAAPPHGGNELKNYRRFIAGDGRHGWINRFAVEKLTDMIPPTPNSGKTITCKDVSALILPTSPDRGILVNRLIKDGDWFGDATNQPIESSRSSFQVIVLKTSDYADAEDPRTHWYRYDDGTIRNDPTGTEEMAGVPVLLVRYLSEITTETGPKLAWFTGYLLADIEEKLGREGDFAIQWTPRTMAGLGHLDMAPNTCRGPQKLTHCFTDFLARMFADDVDIDDRRMKLKDIAAEITGTGCGLGAQAEVTFELKVEADLGPLQWFSWLKPSASAGSKMTYQLSSPDDELLRFDQFSNIAHDLHALRVGKVVKCSKHRLARYTASIGVTAYRRGPGQQSEERAVFMETAERSDLTRVVDTALRRFGVDQEYVKEPNPANY